MLIPRLLELCAPVAAVQNIVQRRDRFDHQKMTDRRGGRGGDLTLIDKSELGEKFHRIFARAAGNPLNPFLTRDGLEVIAISVPSPLSCTEGCTAIKRMEASFSALIYSRPTAAGCPLHPTTI